MNTALSELINAYLANYDVLKSYSKMESGSTSYAAASNLLCAHHMIVDTAGLLQCRNLLRANEKLFSSFRAYTELFSVCVLYISGDPEAKLLRAKQNYTALRKHFSDSSMLSVVAFLLDEIAKPEQIPAIAERAKLLYKKMRKIHPFLTGSEDILFTAVLALSSKSDDDLIDETESIYKLVTPLTESNARQTISHILSMTDEPVEAKCEKLSVLCTGLKNAGIKYRNDLSFAILAMLSLLNDSPEEIVSDIAEVSAAIAENKKYQGIFGIDTKTRLTHTAMILSTHYASSNSVSGYLGIVIAVMAAVEAAEAAATSAAIISTT